MTNAPPKPAACDYAYVVGWVNPGNHAQNRGFDALGDAYAFFSYLVYLDGQAVGVLMFDAQGKMVVNWDSANGEMRSASHPDADKIRDMK